MSHVLDMVFSDLASANKWANFFDSVVAVFDDAPLNVQAELLSVKTSPGFCCCPDWALFDGPEYDTKAIQSAQMRQFWLVSDTMISALNTKEPIPIGASSEYFSPLLHYPDRVKYATDNMLEYYQSIDDLTAEQLAELEALGNDFYTSFPTHLWDSFSQDTKDFLFTELGEPTQIIEA